MPDEPEIIPLFPLNTVLLPGIALPLHIFEERYKQMVGTCILTSGYFGVVLIATGQEVGEAAVPYQVGTTAKIIGVERQTDGRMNIVCVGQHRFRILEEIGGMPYQQARVEFWPDEPADCDVVALAAAARDALRAFLSVDESGADDAVAKLPENPLDLANVMAASLPVDLAERQALLEEPSTCARLRR